MDGQIIRAEYSDIMQKSYIDYAMSVIISRALPDVRDGLKPVQRRTLYDMYELGIRYDRPYRKCARIVGDTMGKYHPHGDSSIYEALVVMAQEFKKGNGRSLTDTATSAPIEGDGAAAMRIYRGKAAEGDAGSHFSRISTRMSSISGRTSTRPRKSRLVLPVRIPNLLVNGSDGIAVGMATSIPPHNLAEVIDATKALIKNNQLTTHELMKYIKGPDFPTGGTRRQSGRTSQKIYETGRGSCACAARSRSEQVKGGKERLVITEIPYTMMGANIGKFLNDIASLVETKKTTDIVDISNQSSKAGIRIVLELKKGADAEQPQKPYSIKRPRLEDTFGVNMLAVADGRPETLSLQPDPGVPHRLPVRGRRRANIRDMLDKERKNDEVQEGLIRACDVIDLIIEVLRGSKKQGAGKGRASSTV